MRKDTADVLTVYLKVGPAGKLSLCLGWLAPETLIFFFKVIFNDLEGNWKIPM